MKEKIGNLYRSLLTANHCSDMNHSDHGRPKMQIYFHFDLNP